jgi:hypothetical protein
LRELPINHRLLWHSWVEISQKSAYPPFHPKKRCEPDCCLTGSGGLSGTAGWVLWQGAVMSNKSSTEIIAGMSVFLSMSYIAFANPVFMEKAVRVGRWSPTPSLPASCCCSR